MTKRATASRKAPARKPAPAQEPSSDGGRQTLLIGVVVVAVLAILCCCLSLVLGWLFGDSIVNGLSSAAGLVAAV